MSREQIQIKGDWFLISPRGGMNIQTTNPEGYFETGLTVHVFFNVHRNMRRTASAMARSFMENPPEQLIPTSQIVRQRDGELVVYRRFFRSESLVSLGKRMSPKNYYIEFTANGLTDTAYHVLFETPTERR